MNARLNNTTSVSEKSSAKTANNAEGKCIVLYEDDPEILLLCKVMLKKKQYHVETFTTCDNVVEDRSSLFIVACLYPALQLILSVPNTQLKILSIVTTLILYLPFIWLIVYLRRYKKTNFL